MEQVSQVKQICAGLCVCARACAYLCLHMLVCVYLSPSVSRAPPPSDVANLPRC